MNGELVIRRLDRLTHDRFADLLAEGEASGYRFLRRVIEEWESGFNRFTRQGEALFAAEVDDRLVGICGLSVDPYLNDPRIGRVRNVYVLAEYRGSGIGRRLVERAIASARGHFDQLRLRAEEEGPARLYESLGFRPYPRVPDCTHIMDLPGEYSAA
ncbi:MAG: N-acetyltransferase family protein [Isosphaeraceae bacterium]